MSRHDDFRVGWPMCVFARQKSSWEEEEAAGKVHALKSGHFGRFHGWFSVLAHSLCLCPQGQSEAQGDTSVSGLGPLFFALLSLLGIHKSIHKYPKEFLLTQ